MLDWQRFREQIGTDSALEEAGFEPLVPLEKGQALRCADRDGLSACPANCENDCGTTSSNPLSSAKESMVRSGLSPRRGGRGLSNCGAAGHARLAGAADKTVANLARNREIECIALPPATDG